MPVLESTIDRTSLARALRDRRIWYHDIEVLDGLRTRFEEDYSANPVVRRIDECSRELVRRVDEALPPSLAGMKVLDLGCADGLLSVWAARRGAKKVVGIERNRCNFERAQLLRSALRLDQVEFRCGSIERCCGDTAFDVVFCFGLIYHLLDPLGTLHGLRERCRGRLFLSSAIDLEDGDGSPLSRLDRYAIGSHGLWSFNVPMVRQLLATAGLHVEKETIEETPGGRRYWADAVVSDCADHHIFADTIHQEFPIDLTRRAATVRRIWRELATTAVKPVAVFGAGTHTPWLLEQVADLAGVTVRCVMDDRTPVTTDVAGLPVVRPTDVDPASIDAVVLSSWHQTEVLGRRAFEVFGDRVPIVSLESKET